MYQGLQCILLAWFDTKKNVNKTFIFIAFYAKKRCCNAILKKEECRRKYAPFFVSLSVLFLYFNPPCFK